MSDPLIKEFEIVKFNTMVDNINPAELPALLKQLYLLYTDTCIMYRQLLEDEITRNCQIEFGKTVAQNEDLS